MVAGLVAEHPGHPDVVWVVKLEEILCPRRMRDRKEKGPFFDPDPPPLGALNANSLAEKSSSATQALRLFRGASGSV
jgi:hypothetical protein